MTKLKEVFTDLIVKGAKTAEVIPEADKKAMAYAALAQAIADSHLLIEFTQVDSIKLEAEGKESIKPAASKGKKKATSKSKEETPVAVVEEEIKSQDPIKEEIKEIVKEIAEKEEATKTEEVPVEANELIIEDEWTEAMQNHFAEDLDLLNQYIEAWTSSYVAGDCLRAFFEDQTITEDQLWDYIRPANLNGFVTYLISLQNA